MIKYACWKRIIFRIFSRYFFECYFFLHPVKSHYLTCNGYWSMVVGLISHLSSTWLLTATTYWPVNITINSPFTPLMMQDLQKWCLWMNELLICLIQLAVWVVWLCCVQIPRGVKVGVHYIVSLFFVHKVTINLYWLI